MVHLPKYISHTTNIKLEPYSVITDISTADTDYASIASNDSFYNNPSVLDGQPIFGPRPKHTLSTKNHSESNHFHQFVGNDMKQNSCFTITDTAIHCGKPSEELNIAPINIPVAGKCDIDRQKLGTKIETTGESKIETTSTDQDLEVNEIDSIKLKMMEMTPTVTLQSTPQSIKSDDIHDRIDDKSIMQNSQYKQQKHVVDLPAPVFVPSMAMKTQKMMNATYRTAISQEDIYLKSNPGKEKRTNELMLGIGKILRGRDGGIAVLYKNALERPDSRLSKILYSML